MAASRSEMSSRITGLRLCVANCAALALCMATLFPATAQAHGYEATRLGAFLGAMKHCEERYGERERRYQRARMVAARELDDKGRNERLRAMAARERAYERGQFMGNRLDREGCRSLLRASEWKQFSGD